MMLALLLVAQSLTLQQDSLTINDAVALAHRGQVAVATSVVAAARADMRVLVELPNPTASYSYSGDPPRQHVTVDQSLDRLLRRGSAGAAGIGVALADSTQLLAVVVREARSAFYAALGTARRLALAEEEAGFTDSLAGIAARRRAVGEISELEQAQAALEAARARQLVSASREDHQLAIAELGRALGVPPEALGVPAGALDRELSGTVPPTPTVDALPMVAAARADSTMARLLYHAAQWSRIPFPSLQAGVEWNDPSDPSVGSTAAGIRHWFRGRLLRPLAIAVIGALCISVLLSLVATPTLYFLMLRARADPDLTTLEVEQCWQSEARGTVVS